ncbi:MAG: hypothetical protein JWO35_911 [Candidatus Saccharibacteria bacterium]|nr:hypothetical protein [Candidatus Saccharibacteria bacterium]
MFDYRINEDAIIRELNLTDLSPGEQASTLNLIRTLLQDRASIRIELALNSDELTTFNELSTNQAAAEAYLLQKFPNIANMYADELAMIIAQLKIALNI